MDRRFLLKSDLKPKGDQPSAIERLVRGLREGRRFQTLLGVTGSGKTFTIANVIEALQRPTLVISHNKTLAAQLFSEFRDFFPENAVEYFVSYYDYYQPEAYIPQTDTYIEKDASINEDLDRLRLSATSSLLTRRDVIVVASVSCIYGLGSPEEYRRMTLHLRVGDELDRYRLLRRLAELQYARNDYEFKRGTFRVRGGVVDLFPSYSETALRLELAGDFLERIRRIDPLSGSVLEDMDELTIAPAKHFVFGEDTIEAAVRSIEAELETRLKELNSEGKLLEAERLESRTRYDIEMLREIGYCPGIENYSRHLSGRPPGSRPWTLMDYFPDDFLLVIDESHVTVPQIRGMYLGDHNRKKTLVEHGFRLPSALDNRPLRFEEFEELLNQVIFVSATPGPYELKRCGGEVVEQIIRPTGLVDPPVEVRPASTQIKDLLRELRDTAGKKQRALVTTLTKRLAEEVAEFIGEAGLSCTYLHSELDAIERVEILRKLRRGDFEIVVGVNLLREGLDLPEVALVAVLDADREGFLRSVTSLIQIIGRTARNADGRVILYADRITSAIRDTIEETDRRRRRQIRYNEKHGIVPRSISSPLKPGISEIVRSNRLPVEDPSHIDLAERIGELEEEMFRLADQLQFEQAAKIRDEILRLQGKSAPSGSPRGKRRKKKRGAKPIKRR